MFLFSLFFFYVGAAEEGRRAAFPCSPWPGKSTPFFSLFMAGVKRTEFLLPRMWLPFSSSFSEIQKKLAPLPLFLACVRRAPAAFVLFTAGTSFSFPLARDADQTGTAGCLWCCDDRREAGLPLPLSPPFRYTSYRPTKNPFFAVFYRHRPVQDMRGCHVGRLKGQEGPSSLFLVRQEVRELGVLLS